MDILKQINEAVKYIETHLCDEIDMNRLSEIALYPADSFKRFFRYMTGMTVSEYIRKRRLTLAAYELQKTNIKVIDVAIKYGYNNSDSFSRAFLKQHGVLPTMARKSYTSLKIYPPASFHITIKGAKEMNFKIINSEEIKLKGLSRKFSGKAANRFEQEHIMWADHHDDIQNKVCQKIEGVWYGIWNKGVYSIAKKTGEVDNSQLESIKIPSGKYAVFSTNCGGFAGDELPKLRSQIFENWLVDSGYIQTDDYEIEIYYLFSKSEKHKRHYEIWIPVETVQ